MTEHQGIDGFGISHWPGTAGAFRLAGCRCTECADAEALRRAQQLRANAARRQRAADVAVVTQAADNLPTKENKA